MKFAADPYMFWRLTVSNELDKEREFHDQWASTVSPSEVDVLGSWTALATPETNWISQKLGDLTDLKVLDLGCGLGEGSVYFAIKGARVTASDLSPGMCDLTRRVAKANGVDVETLVASATDLKMIPDNTFDIVYGANMLHHVDIKACVDEVHRILKPGGRAAFWDPVHYNPVINVYRKMAAGVRTEDEHPLKISDVQYIKKKFGSTETKFFWFTATLIFVRFFLIDRIQPSEGRYWKLIIDRRDKHRHFLKFAHTIDRAILFLIRPLKWWCWNVAIVARKDT
jgi:SAM-dependent methyltransferase